MAHKICYRALTGLSYGTILSFRSVQRFGRDAVSKFLTSVIDRRIDIRKIRGKGPNGHIENEKRGLWKGKKKINRDTY